MFLEPCRKNIGLKLVQNYSKIAHKSYFGQLGVASYAPFCFRLCSLFGCDLVFECRSTMPKSTFVDISLAKFQNNDFPMGQV